MAAAAASGAAAQPQEVKSSALSVPQSRYNAYDFTPFIDAPNVQKKIRENGGRIPLISPIPPTRIPSPFARNLHPATVEDIHNFLLGEGKYSNPLMPNYTGNGREVWESWKRAWDLWNNHFIEGRVNEVWVAQAYKKYEEWEKYRTRPKPPRRRPKRRPKTGPYRTEEVAIRETDTYLADKSADYRRRAIFELQANFDLNRHRGPGYVEYCEALSTRTRLHADAPKFDDFHNYSMFGEGYLPLTEEQALEEFEKNHSPEQVESLQENLRYNSSRGPGYVEFALATEEQIQASGTLEVAAWLFPPVLENFVPARNEESILASTPPENRDALQAAFDLNRHLGVGYLEYSIAQVEHEVKTRDMLAEFVPPKPLQADYIGQVYPGPVPSPDPGSGSETDDGPEPRDINEKVVPVPPVVDADGSSGGFFAMKDFQDYATPDDVDVDEVDSDADVNVNHYDPIDDSVWRPKRVGEKELKIDMDEQIEDFLANTDLEFDGGVDCGRSPYPLLRPIVRYARSTFRTSHLNPQNNQVQEKETTLFKIQKNWDGVTGTIFNMPIKPPDDSEVEYPIDNVAQRLYGDVNQRLASDSYINPKYFPLDIRRVTRLLSDVEKGPPPAYEGSEDTIIKPFFKRVQRKIRSMFTNDPWWVTPEQREARDVPPRTWPPKVDETSSHLPQDFKPWNDEVDYDTDYKKRYFVGNLDGRLLLINGLQVSKGEIAGPLPEFAVIQTEGGGVAFWFGVGGRYYKEPAQLKDRSADWRQLRRKKAYWTNIALPPGLVWRRRILEKIREPDEGEGEQDENWIRWKNAKPVVSKRRRSRRLHGDGTRVGNSSGGENSNDSDNADDKDDGGAPGPLPFANLQEELSWVAAQHHFQQLGEQPLAAAQMKEPTIGTAWGTLPNDYRTPLDNPSNEQRAAWWQSNQAQIRASQQEATDTTFRELTDQRQAADEQASQEEHRKRQQAGDGYSLPDAKRAKTLIDQRMNEAQARIDRQEEAERFLIEQINRHIFRGRTVTSFGLKDIHGRVEQEISEINPALLHNLQEKILQETQAAREMDHNTYLNSLNASRRIKQGEIAKKRKEGNFGFMQTTEAGRTEQQQQREMERLKRLREENFQKSKELLTEANRREQEVRNARYLLSKLKSTNDQFRMKRAEEALEEARQKQIQLNHDLAVALSESNAAQAWGIDQESILKYIQENPISEYKNALHSQIQKTINANVMDNARETAKSQGISLEDHFRRTFEVETEKEYLERINASGPKFLDLSDYKNVQEYDEAFLQELLPSRFTSWEQAIESLPVRPRLPAHDRVREVPPDHDELFSKTV